MRIKKCKGCERVPHFKHIYDDNGHQFVRAECGCGRKSTYHHEQRYAVNEWNSIARKVSAP